MQINMVPEEIVGQHGPEGRGGAVRSGDGGCAGGLPPIRNVRRHQEMVAAYGFGLFPVAAYEAVAVGPWRLARHRGGIGEGYAAGAVFEGDRFVLYKGSTAWMSTGLMEQESHAVHVHRARGLVVAAGLGLGLFALAAALKDEVERVVVVEHDADVADLVARATRLQDWPGRDKLSIIIADAFDAGLAARIATVAGRRPVDYLYVDIWPVMAAPEAAGDTAALVRTVQPKAAGWWGQELSFGLWCRQRERRPDAEALSDYVTETGVPVPVDPGFVAFCADVIRARLGGPPGNSPNRVSRAGRWRRRLRRLLRRPA